MTTMTTSSGAVQVVKPTVASHLQDYWGRVRGGDIGSLLAPGIDTQVEFLAAADALWREVVASDFPSRAEAIADLVAAESPDVLGLQEVATWSSVSLVDGSAGGYDFLAILLAELAARGTPYEVVVDEVNFDSAVLTAGSPVPGHIPLP